MAETIGTAYVQIEPSFEGGVSKIDKEFGNVGESSGKSFSSGFGKVVAGAITASTAAVGAFGKAAITAGAEYESAFAQVQTIMDSSIVSTEDMSAAIQDLSSNMGISASELSNTVYNAISATGDTANAVTLAAQASKLATAGFTDTGSALSVLTTAMNAYGMSAEEASNISDSLIAVQNLGVTTVSELSASMGKAIASASAYNVNLGNLESAYVSLTKGGINTAESTTYISSMLKELGSSSSAVGKTIQKETGKSFADLMNEGKSLGDVLGILNDSVNGDATALMNLWSSAEAGKASNAIISQGLSEFNNNLMSISKSAGMTQSAYDTMANTLQHKTEVFKTLGTNLLTSVYSGMSGELGSFVDFGNEAMQALSDGFNSGGVNGLMDAVGTVLSQAIKLIVDKLPSLIDAGMQLMGALASGILDNLPAILAVVGEVVLNLASSISDALPTLIPAISNVIVELVTILTDPGNLQMVIESAVQIILALADGLLQALPQLIAALPQVITSIVTALTNPETLSALIQGAIQLVTSITQSLPTIIQALVDAIPQVIEALTTALTNPESLATLIEGFIQLAISLAAAFPEIFAALGEAVPQVVMSIGQAFLQLGPQLKTSLTQACQIAGPSFDQLATFAQQSWAKIQSAFGQVGSWFKNKFTEAVNGIKSIFNTLKAYFQQKYNEIINVFANIGSKFMEVGKNIVAGIREGIAGSWGKFTDWLEGLFGDLVDLAKKILGIESPSKEFASEVGRWIPAGIALGIEEGMDVLKKTTTAMTDEILDTATMNLQVGSTLTVPNAPDMTNATDNRTMSILAEYLPVIAKEISRPIEVKQNDRGTFEAVRAQNTKLVTATGYHALA